MWGQKKGADLHASGDFLLPSLEEDEKDEKDRGKKGKMDQSAAGVLLVLSTVRVNFLILSLNHTQSPMTSVYTLGESQAICSLIPLCVFPEPCNPRVMCSQGTILSWIAHLKCMACIQHDECCCRLLCFQSTSCAFVCYGAGAGVFSPLPCLCPHPVICLLPDCIHVLCIKPVITLSIYTPCFFVLSQGLIMLFVSLCSKPFFLFTCSEF